MTLRAWLRRLGTRPSDGSPSPEEPGIEPCARSGHSRYRLAVDDCAAFLDGSLAEYRAEHGQPVAPWEWTNLLAHASEETLRDQLDPRGDEEVSPVAWRGARSYLIQEILDLASEQHRSLSDLQRGLLVPFELDLAADPDVQHWSPTTWLIAVDAVLPTRHRRALPDPPHPRAREGPAQRQGPTTVPEGPAGTAGSAPPQPRPVPGSMPSQPARRGLRRSRLE